MSTTYLITGATRGIGIELAKQLSENESNHVIGTYRSDSSAKQLFELASKRKNVDTVKLDVSDEASIKLLPKQLDAITSKLDIVIFNAAIADSYIPILKTPLSVWQEHFQTNTFGPVLIFQQVYPYLKKSDHPAAHFISSVAGSIGYELPFQVGAYGASKAALNYIVKKIGEQHPELVTSMLHPGMVETTMGRYGFDTFNALSEDSKPVVEDGTTVSPALSATRIIQAIEDPATNGKFIDVADRSVIPF